VAGEQWWDSVRTKLTEAFAECLFEEERVEAYKLQEHMDLATLFGRIQAVANIVLSKELPTELGKKGEVAKLKIMPYDIVRFDSVGRHSNLMGTTTTTAAGEWVNERMTEGWVACVCVWVDISEALATMWEGVEEKGNEALRLFRRSLAEFRVRFVS
jgi:hypothetical protein